MKVQIIQTPRENGSKIGLSTSKQDTVSISTEN